MEERAPFPVCTFGRWKGWRKGIATFSLVKELTWSEAALSDFVNCKSVEGSCNKGFTCLSENASIFHSTLSYFHYLQFYNAMIIRSSALIAGTTNDSQSGRNGTVSFDNCWGARFQYFLFHKIQVIQVNIVSQLFDNITAPS